VTAAVDVEMPQLSCAQPALDSQHDNDRKRNQITDLCALVYTPCDRPLLIHTANIYNTDRLRNVVRSRFATRNKEMLQHKLVCVFYSKECSPEGSSKNVPHMFRQVNFDICVNQSSHIPIYGTEDI
jgi:hypothetical protein